MYGGVDVCNAYMWAAGRYIQACKRVSYVRTCLYGEFKCDVKHAFESWNGLVRAVAMLYSVVVDVPRLSRREFMD
jgi:hypothetical protein